MNFKIILIVTFVAASYIGVFAGKDKQVICIFEDNREPNRVTNLNVHKAARFLFNKHKATSYVVKWNGVGFDQQKWNDFLQKYENFQEQLLLEEDDWKNTKIQVVGHGDIKSDTIAGMDAKKMAAVLINNLVQDKDVGQISIVSCTRSATLAENCQYFSEKPAFLEKFMKKLKALGQSKTEVSLLSSLVSVDSCGRKFVGQFIKTGNKEVGIQWSYRDSSKKWIGKFLNDGSYEIKQSKIVAQPELKHVYGILPENQNQVYITSSELTYEMKSQDIYNWIDRIAELTYNRIPEGSENRPKESQQVVLFYWDPNNPYEEILLREIHSITDLLIELKHYDIEGPQSGKPEYYRFGDWVVSLDPYNFYAHVEGIVIDHTEYALHNYKTKWELIQQLHESEGLPPEYYKMQRQVNANFFDDVQNWISGNDIKVQGISSAYNAQCGIAMFMSESIRCFHNHITNMMLLDLVEHGYLSEKYFFNIHPMSRRYTWQMVWYGNVKKTGLDLLRDESRLIPDYNFECYDVICDTFESIRSRVTQIATTWLSHVHNNDLSGSSHILPWITPRKWFHIYEKLLTAMEDIGEVTPQSKCFLRDYELRTATDKLFSRDMSLQLHGKVPTLEDIQESLYLSGYKFVYDQLPYIMNRFEHHGLTREAGIAILEDVAGLPVCVPQRKAKTETRV